AGADGTIKLWDAASTDGALRSGRAGFGGLVRVSREGTRVAFTCPRDGAGASDPAHVAVVDGTGQELTRFKGHGGRALGLETSPDGTRVASAALRPGGDRAEAELAVWAA